MQKITIETDNLRHIKILSETMQDKIDSANSYIKQVQNNTKWFCHEKKILDDELDELENKAFKLKFACEAFGVEANMASNTFEKAVAWAQIQYNGYMFWGTKEVYSVVNEGLGETVISPFGSTTLNLIDGLRDFFLQKKHSSTGKFQGQTLALALSLVGTGSILTPATVFFLNNHQLTQGYVENNVLQNVSQSGNNANVNNSYQIPPINISTYGLYNNPNTNFYHQCTAYSIGRMNELGVNVSDVNANGDYFCAEAANSGHGTYISVQQARDGEILNLGTPALCSCYGGFYGGHVLVIEKVEKVNNQIKIHYSEGNSDGAGIYNSEKDGVVKTANWEDFLNEHFYNDLGANQMAGLSNYAWAKEYGGGTRSGYPFGFLKIEK